MRTVNLTGVYVQGAEVIAHRQPVQGTAVVLTLQHAVATDLWAAQQPGDLGAYMWERGRQPWQWTRRQLGRWERGQTDVQRTTPLLVHLINPHLQRKPDQRTNIDLCNTEHHCISRQFGVRLQPQAESLLPQTTRLLWALWRWTQSHASNLQLWQPGSLRQAAPRFYHVYCGADEQLLLLHTQHIERTKRLSHDPTYKTLHCHPFDCSLFHLVSEWGSSSQWCCRCTGCCPVDLRSWWWTPGRTDRIGRWLHTPLKTREGRSGRWRNLAAFIKPTEINLLNLRS